MVAKKSYVGQLPALDADNTPFWTGGQQGVLNICKCFQCGLYVHPPSPVCPRCAAPAPVPTPVCGRGRVVSFSVNAHSWFDGDPGDAIFAVVELVEQDRLYLFSRLEGFTPESVRIDAPVQVFFQNEEDVWLPLFRPAAP